MKALVPNLLTLSNLLLSSLAIYLADPKIALFLFVGCLIADVLDGMAARALGVSSELGKQLDSLADLVSFGLMPAYFLYIIYEPSLGHWAFISLLVVCATGYRLAKFNLLPPSKHFLGLPSPASGIFLMALVFVHQFNPEFFNKGLDNLITLLSICVFSMVAMLSKIKLPSLKSEKSIVLILSSGILLFAVLIYFVNSAIMLLVVPVYFILGGLLFNRLSRA